jgi:hypothetical protein
MSDEEPSLQMETIREWIKDHIFYVTRAFNTINIRDQSEKRYVNIDVAASVFAKAMSAELKMYPQISLPLGLDRSYIGLRNTFMRRVKFFIRKYVAPVYKVANRLRRELYHKKFDNQHPINTLLELNLDKFIAQKWRIDDPSSNDRNYYINMFSLIAFTFWMFEIEGKLYAMPVESEEFFQRLDDIFAKDNRRRLVQWDPTKPLSTKRVIVRDDSSFKTPEKTTVEPAKSSDQNVPIVSLEGTAAMHAIEAAKGTSFENSVIFKLNAFNQLVTCVSTYWGFVSKKIVEITHEQDKDIDSTYSLFSRMKGSHFNDHLLVIENDPVKFFVIPYANDREKYEAFLDYLVDTFLKDVTDTETMFKEWYEEQRASIGANDFRELKEHIDLFIGCFDKLCQS